VRGRFGYAFNILIDTPTGVAIDVQASPARFAAEVDAARVMLARAGDRFGYARRCGSPSLPLVLRLPLDARVPHHSTFSKNRHGRFRDASVSRLLFEQTVRRCLKAGLSPPIVGRGRRTIALQPNNAIDAVANRSSIAMAAHPIVG
jgi:hypothetical protein